MTQRDQNRRRLSSKDIAELAIEAVVISGAMRSKDFNRAVDITEGIIESRKVIGDYYESCNNIKQLSSKTLAALIIEAITSAGIVENKDANNAMEIIIEEVDVRKAIGDF